MILDLAPHFAGDVELLPLAAHAVPDDLQSAIAAAGLAPRVLGGAWWPYRLRALARRESVDVVHLHGPYVGAIGRPALVGTGVAVVHTEHSVWPSHRPISRVANALTFARNDMVVAVSQAVADSILASALGNRVRDRLRVIRNGVDVSTIHHDAAAFPPEPSAAPTYVSVGHLRHRKGVDVLLDASLTIAQARPDARGLVVGVGEDEDALREHQQRIGATAVTLLGLRSNARSIIAASDVFVVPSRTEGTPLALLEAMALERPIVATNVGGLPELLTHEANALLVPPEDPHALAAAVVRLLDDRDLGERLGRAARETVERDAGAATAAAAYLDVYHTALRRRA